MSRARSRTPLHSSRNSNQNGRHRDGFYSGQHHSNPWRGQEQANKAESPENWDKSYSQEEGQVDHWAKFIEAIGRAEKEKASPAKRYHAQDEGRRFDEMSTHSPRRSHQEAGTPERNHRRSDQDARSHGNYSRGASPRMKHRYWTEDHEGRYESGSSTTRSQKPNYKDQLHHKRFRHSEPQEEYRGPYTGPRGALIVEHDHGIAKHYGPRNRDSTKLMSRDPPMSQDQPRNRSDHPRSRDCSRSRDPGINPEHSRNRDPQRRSSSVMDRKYSSSTDLFMTREHSRNWNLPRIGGSHLKNSEPLMSRGPSRRPDFLRNNDGHSNTGNCHSQEEKNFRAASPGCKRPMSQHREQPRMKSRPRDSLNNNLRLVDSRSGARGPQWEPERQPGQQEPRNRKIPGPREDLSRHETLKIQVDMSRPVGQSRKENLQNLEPRLSSLEMTGETLRGTRLLEKGCSSDRQLSLDLVHVGRQRLDFLPMLEHSGSSRETATHTGTFAQEIISLVHQVKESYFQGSGVPLNERFSNRQKYTAADVEQFEEAEKLEDPGPIINRPFASRSSEFQVFCKLGPLQKHSQPPGPGDLRFDLEKKRLQKLEGVKITISGNSEISPQELYDPSDVPCTSFKDRVGDDDPPTRVYPRSCASQENEPLYPGVEYRSNNSRSDFRWSEADRRQADRWDGPPAKRPTPNFNARRNFNRFGPQTGPRGRINPNVGTRW